MDGIAPVMNFRLSFPVIKNKRFRGSIQSLKDNPSGIFNHIVNTCGTCGNQ